jgi:hypothetical protein
MQTVLFYLLGLGAFSVAAGGVIAFFALRDAPEGFEDSTGFVGATRGDEVLLKQFNDERAYSTVHHSLDLAT